jgi:DNA polymerase-3 subunit chi
MTQVEFHTGVPDPVAFACRLLRKASRRGVRVLVTAPEALLAELDQQLWTFESREFVPHVRLPADGRPLPERVAARTPIWLATEAGVPGAPPIIVNLDAGAPADLDGFERLIEIVGETPESVERGRLRWRAYKAAGLEVVHHVNAAGE